MSTSVSNTPEDACVLTWSISSLHARFLVKKIRKIAEEKLSTKLRGAWLKMRWHSMIFTGSPTGFCMTDNWLHLWNIPVTIQGMLNKCKNFFHILGIFFKPHYNILFTTEHIALLRAGRERFPVAPRLQNVIWHTGTLLQRLFSVLWNWAAYLILKFGTSEKLYWIRYRWSLKYENNGHNFYSIVMNSTAVNIPEKYNWCANGMTGMAS